MHVMVTGGAGYIGSHAVLALNDAGHEVVVYDNLSRGNRDVLERLAPATFVEGDTRDTARLVAAMTEHGVDAVMHFAAFAYVGESVEDPLSYWDNNVGGTLGLLQAMRESEVDLLVFSSTCATYGEPDEVPIVESSRQEPINPYGMTKLVCERMLADVDVAHGLRTVALRYFNVAGADPMGRVGEMHDPEPHIIPIILDVAAGHRDKFRLNGDDYDTPDGTCIRDYIHVSDLADAHLLALDHLAAGGSSQRLNLGNGAGFSNREIVDAVGRVTGHPIEVEIGPRRPGDPPRLVGSAAQATKLLGWRPRHTDIDSIIEHAWAWHQRADR